MTATCHNQYLDYYNSMCVCVCVCVSPRSNEYTLADLT